MKSPWTFMLESLPFPSAALDFMRSLPSHGPGRKSVFSRCYQDRSKYRPNGARTYAPPRLASRLTRIAEEIVANE